jgi:ABC-type amino acid transport substrate-binding protein
MNSEQIKKIIAEELGLELEIKALAWDALIQNLNTGGIDMIIAGMSPTPERLETIDFTEAYYESTHVLLVKKDSEYASAKKLADFAGATVIGQTGTIYADLVPQAVAAGAVAGNNLATVPLIVNAILNDTVDATIVEEPVAKGICSQYSNLSYVVLSDGFDVAKEDKVVSIGVRKGYDLTEEINEVLKNVLTESVRVQLMEEAIANAPAE